MATPHAARPLRAPDRNSFKPIIEPRTSDQRPRVQDAPKRTRRREKLDCDAVSQQPCATIPIERNRYYTKLLSLESSRGSVVAIRSGGMVMQGGDAIVGWVEDQLSLERIRVTP
jgi:hypothetical protein